MSKAKDKVEKITMIHDLSWGDVCGNKNANSCTENNRYNLSASSRDDIKTPYRNAYRQSII